MHCGDSRRGVAMHGGTRGGARGHEGATKGPTSPGVMIGEHVAIPHGPTVATRRTVAYPTVHTRRADEAYPDESKNGSISVCACVRLMVGANHIST